MRQYAQLVPFRIFIDIKYMEDPGSSSCSFMTDADDNMSNFRDSMSIQQLQLEKEHLKEVNSQLQSNIELLKAQLKEATEATTGIDSLNVTITNLRQQLNEARERENKLHKDIKKISNEGDMNQSRLSVTLESISAERNATLEKLASEQEHVAKLRKERQQLREDNEEKIRLMDSLALDLKDTKAQKKKLRNKLVTVAEHLQEAEGQIQLQNQQIQSLKVEKETMLQELDNLRIQLSTSKSINDECDAAINSVNKDLETKTSIIKQLEIQYDAQRQELEDFNEERQMILALFQKLHSVISLSELRIENLMKENEILKAKSKSASRKAPYTVSSIDLASIHIPFTGEFADKAMGILRLPQYQPVQRIQLILNEAAKRMADLEAELASLRAENDSYQTQLAQMSDSQPAYCQVLNALLSELKSIAITEAQFGKSNICKNDPAFIDFVSQKCADIEPLIKESLLKDPEFIPSDFFSTPDIQKRKEYIQKLFKPCDIGFSIFVAQFLTNILLRNQLEAIMGPLNKVEELSQMDIIQGGDISDIPGIIKRLQEQVIKYKNKSKHLHCALKKSQQAQLNLAKADNDNKTKISQLMMEKEALQNEIDVIRVKYQVAANELSLKSNDMPSGCGAHHARDDMDPAAKEKLARLEEALEAKTKECNQLSCLISSLQSTLEESTRKQHRHWKKHEDAYKQQIIELQQQIDYMENQLITKKKNAKRNEKSLKERYDASVRELSAHYEESKKALINTIEELKEKARQAREMSRKLVDSMAETEQKNQKLQADVVELSNQQKTANAQLAQAKQQMAKEKQNIKAQLAAQMMACESKSHSATQEVKAESEKHLKEILNIAAETIGQFYDVDEVDFNEESYVQLLNQAKQDIEKLQFFQSEATKLPVN